MQNEVREIEERKIPHSEKHMQLLCRHAYVSNERKNLYVNPPTQQPINDASNPMNYSISKVKILSK